MNSLKTKAVKAFALASMISFLTINFSSCYIFLPDKGGNTEDVVQSDDSENKTTDENKDAEKTDAQKQNDASTKPVEKKKYTVTFNTNGGTAVDSQTVEEGSTATKPATAPTKEGVVFAGWYKESTFENAFDFSTAIKADTTIYANWASEADIATITFESNGGSAVTALKVQKGKTTTAPSSPSKEYYNFKGWYKEAALTNQFDFTTAITDSITLYAKWELQRENVNVDIAFDGLNNIEITCKNTETNKYRISTKEGLTSYRLHRRDGTAFPCDLRPQHPDQQLVATHRQYHLEASHRRPAKGNG